jgi:hypothetical protein
MSDMKMVQHCSGAYSALPLPDAPVTRSPQFADKAVIVGAEVEPQWP